MASMQALFYLNKYLLKYKWHLIWGIVFITISNIFAIYPAQIVRDALDEVSKSIVDYQASGSAQAKAKIYASFARQVLIFGAVVVLMAILKGVFMFFMRQSIIVMSRRIEYDLKNEIYAHYQKLNMSFYRRNNTGDLMARISEDVSRVRMYVGPAIMYTINLLVLFILVIITMLKVNMQLTLIVLLPLPLMAWLVYKVSNTINQKSERVQAQLSSLSTYVQEALSGVRVLKSFVKEQHFSTVFASESEIYKKKSMDLVQVNGLFTPIVSTLIGLSIILTIYIGGKKAIAGEITAGNIAEFIIYVNMLTWPVTAVGWVTSLVQRAAASQQRINEFLHQQPEIENSNAAAMQVQGKIEFKGLSFTYPDTGVQALKNINFNIAPGECLAVLGNTGSGKSTLAALLTRCYDSSEGSVLIDGINIKKWNLAALRSQTGYVPQDVFLFSDTIYNNIAFGLNKQTENLEQLVTEAAKNAVVYENIMRFPDQFNTEIGERGITLSGGQKQRVSIARAIIKKPAILIFDDCLSAVDTETEEEILRNLEQQMKGRSSIIISHRVSSARFASNIIVLHNGQIVEQGSPQALIEAKGHYYQMMIKQQNEETLETLAE